MPCWSPDGKSIAYVLWTDGGSDVRVAPADGTGTSRGVTLGAQAFKVRWLWSRNVLLVLGFWGNHLPGVRLVTPTGGETSVINIPAAVAPDSDGPDFDSSLDGTLLAFTQSTRQTELWVLEADEGTF